MAKTGRPTLSPERQQRLIKLVDHLVATKYGNNAAALARDLGISAPSLHAIKKQGGASAETVMKLCEIGGVPVSDYFDMPAPPSDEELAQLDPRAKVRVSAHWRSAPEAVRNAFNASALLSSGTATISDLDAMEEFVRLSRLHERGQLPAAPVGEPDDGL